MKTLSCKDMGTMECDFVAKGETEDEIVGSMMDHAKQSHPDKITMMPEEEMKNMMKSKVKDEMAGEATGETVDEVKPEV